MSAAKKGKVNIRPMRREDMDAVLAINRKISPTQTVFTRREFVACGLGGHLI
jgi:hypothetical protein